MTDYDSLLKEQVSFRGEVDGNYWDEQSLYQRFNVLPVQHIILCQLLSNFKHLDRGGLLDSLCFKARRQFMKAYCWKWKTSLFAGFCKQLAQIPSHYKADAFTEAEQGLFLSAATSDHGTTQKVLN